MTSFSPGEEHGLLDNHFSFHRLRFHLEPKVPLHLPAYNKGNEWGCGQTFNIVLARFPTRPSHDPRVKSGKLLQTPIVHTT
jgi:hypothetical protein